MDIREGDVEAFIAEQKALREAYLAENDPLPEDFPRGFIFASGAGAWGSSLSLWPDGTFTGSYHDSEMGENGEDYPNGTVYMHRKKDVIADMQQMLVQLGYLSAATGNYDRATEDAVKKIQRKANFPIDGIAWPQTMNYLRSQVAVQGGTSTPVPQQPVYQQPVATAPAVTKAPPATPVDRQAYCTQTDIINGMTSTIYCASHQALIESCEMMLNLAQSEMLRTEALRMYRMLLENNLKELYERWQAAAPVETKQIVVTHQAMSASYLNMQEMTWKFQYGESDIRVMENVVDALMKQCAEVCMLLGQSNVP